MGVIMKPKPATSTYEKEPFKIDSEVEFDFHIDRGMYLLKEQKYNQASDEFRKLIELDPSDVEAHRLLGEALYRKGAYDEALKEFDKKPSSCKTITLMPTTGNRSSMQRWDGRTKVCGSIQSHTIATQRISS